MPDEPVNKLFGEARWLLLSWAATVTIVTLYSTYFRLSRRIRQLICLDKPIQRYFFEPNKIHAAFKHHLLDAPCFRYRHFQTLTISQKLPIGNLPGRCEALYLFLHFSVNLLLHVRSIDWSDEHTATITLRSRSGTLSTLHIFAVVMLATRHNPLTMLFGVPRRTIGVLHRWFGRIAILEAVIHAAAHITLQIRTCT